MWKSERAKQIDNLGEKHFMFYLCNTWGKLKAAICTNVLHEFTQTHKSLQIRILVLNILHLKPYSVCWFVFSRILNIHLDSNTVDSIVFIMFVHFHERDNIHFMWWHLDCIHVHLLIRLRHMTRYHALLYHQQRKHFNIWNFHFEIRIKRNHFCLSFMNRFVSNIIKYEFYRYVWSVNSVKEREKIEFPKINMKLEQMDCWHSKILLLTRGIRGKHMSI